MPSSEFIICMMRYSFLFIEFIIKNNIVSFQCFTYMNQNPNRTPWTGLVGSSGITVGWVPKF